MVNYMTPQWQQEFDNLSNNQGLHYICDGKTCDCDEIVKDFITNEVIAKIINEIPADAYIDVGPIEGNSKLQIGIDLKQQLREKWL